MTAKRVRPMWKVEEKKFVIINAADLLPEQLKYLKAYIDKDATPERKEKLIAAIKANETAKVIIAPKEEVAAAKEQPTKTDKKAPKSIIKDRVFEKGQLISIGQNMSLKVLSADTKVKVGHFAFVPDFKSLNETKPEDMYMQITYIGRETVWFVELTSENAIPVSVKAANEHFLDEEGQDSKDWIPYYLCDLVDDKVDQPKVVVTTEPVLTKAEKKAKLIAEVEAANKKATKKTTPEPKVEEAPKKQTLKEKLAARKAAKASA